MKQCQVRGCSSCSSRHPAHSRKSARAELEPDGHDETQGLLRHIALNEIALGVSDPRERARDLSRGNGLKAGIRQERFVPGNGARESGYVGGKEGR